MSVSFEFVREGGGGGRFFFEVLDTLIRVTFSSRCDPLIGYLNFIS